MENKMEIKDTNPKDSIGIKKVPFSVIPANVLGEIGLGLLEGGIKYRRHNYRVAGVRASVYYDATLRHLFSWWEGENIDPDSSINHIGKAIASLVVLRDSMMNENWNDDRPPKIKQGWIKDLNKKAQELIDSFTEIKQPYTELNKDKKSGSQD